MSVPMSKNMIDLESNNLPISRGHKTPVASPPVAELITSADILLFYFLSFAPYTVFIPGVKRAAFTALYPSDSEM